MKNDRLGVVGLALIMGAAVPLGGARAMEGEPGTPGPGEAAAAAQAAMGQDQSSGGLWGAFTGMFSRAWDGWTNRGPYGGPTIRTWTDAMGVQHSSSGNGAPEPNGRAGTNK